jgi:hypothetical protein
MAAAHWAALQQNAAEIELTSAPRLTGALPLLIS